VPTVSLPEQPSFEHLRKQAKDLRRAVRAGVPDAVAEAAEHHPAGPSAEFTLSAAQLVIARRYGFASWARLKRHLEVVERYTRVPARMEDEGAGVADTFLRLACLSYEDDQPERRTRARRLLAEHPDLTRGSMHAAAAAADVQELERNLTGPGARREGGPYRWEPLFYLAYARHDPAIPEQAVLRAARLLLDAGADPNAGYLWHGLPTPFTVLTGVFGGGEAGPGRQPAHPHSRPLSRLLLEAGADPNDGQALYNRMFEPANDHLEILFEFGLGTGDGGPWRARLGDAVDTPAELVRGQLRWAITHGLTERVRLLVAHGVDLTTPFGTTTPAELAAVTGHAELVDHLVANGAPDPDLNPVDDFVSAALGADQAKVDRLRADHPGLVEAARSARPALVVWAAAHGSPGAVRLLVEAGFDVNAKGRTDVPRNTKRETALHTAVLADDPDLAGTLLALGADPDIHDARFDATPLGWARNFARERLVELLQPITTEAET
jgi:ankyrin repeat protein